jgi:8-oxo-dGTP pyrophosphatase MutT (NUDIX family)
MTAPDDELETSRRFEAAQRPRDAATLVIVRRDGVEPRVLLGKRHSGHAFMPDKFVFPGGRLDRADCRMQALSDLDRDCLARLLSRMRGTASASRARGLALAAIRETFEEVGLIVGTAASMLQRAPSRPWQEFLATGHMPELRGLRFFMRAITPPGRTRRFDTRFFLADAAHIGNLDRPHHGGSGELLESAWFTFGEALRLDLPSVTRDVLERLSQRIVAGGWPQPQDPVPFQYQRRGQWQLDLI